MATAPDDGRVRRVAALDRMWGATSVVASVGPIDVPSVPDLRAALRELADPFGVTRIGRVLAADRRTYWSTGRLDEFCAGAVVAGTDSPGTDLGVRTTAIMARGRQGRPLQFVAGANSLSLNVAHCLGDGYYMTRLLPAVIETARTGSAPAWARRPVERRPLMRALLAYFGRHPARAMDLGRYLRTRPVPAPAGPGGPEVVWAPSPRLRFRASSPQVLSALKTWRKTNAPGLSTVPVILAAVQRAHAELGIRSNPAGPLVLFDARRYLPRGAGEVSGNFSAGLRIPVARPGDPLAVHAGTAAAIGLGRPLAVLAMAAATGWRRQDRVVGRASVGAPWDVAFTHLGRPPEIARLPWRDGPVPPYYLGLLTPSGPTAVTYAISEIGNRLNVSASFHDNVVDSRQIDQVLELLCGDPIGLIESGARAVRPAGVAA